MDRKRILMIEDEENVLVLNERTLRRYSSGAVHCVKARTLKEARTILSDTERDFDLIMLDIMLPDGSGLDFVEVAHELSNAPILMLSARNTREDVFEGLARGGDNYITKPYDPDDLCARVFAMLRREDNRAKSEPPKTLTRGALTLDLEAGRAYANGEDMVLTGKEFSLLRVFIQNEDKNVSAEYLYEQVWKTSAHGDTRTIKYHVSNLRKKLAGSGYGVASERNEGYRFEKSGE